MKKLILLLTVIFLISCGKPEYVCHLDVVSVKYIPSTFTSNSKVVYTTTDGTIVVLPVDGDGIYPTGRIYVYKNNGLYTFTKEKK